MEIAKLCQICNRPSYNLITCSLCGRIVCSRCSDPKSGICIQCMRGPQIR